MLLVKNKTKKQVNNPDKAKRGKIKSKALKKNNKRLKSKQQIKSMETSQCNCKSFCLECYVYYYSSIE